MLSLFCSGRRGFRKQALSRTGVLSNDRVCRSSLRVVPVTPYPAPDSVWAPEEACKEEGVGASAK